MNKILRTLALVFVMGLITGPYAQAQFLNKLKKKAKEVVNTGNLSLSNDDIGAGLKEALDAGVGEAVSTLSAKGGYLASAYKIEVPKEAQKVISKVKLVPGFENVERDLVLKMNEAAELAAKKATPIFKDAITSITFDDAMNILTGKDDAATRYLEGRSYQALYDEFLPVIQSALDQVNAREYWTGVVKQYNKIPFVKKVNPQLDDHVNNKALLGLFGLIEVKEEGIRNNVDQRSTELLRRVFAKQD